MKSAALLRPGIVASSARLGNAQPLRSVGYWERLRKTALPRLLAAKEAFEAAPPPSQGKTLSGVGECARKERNQPHAKEATARCRTSCVSVGTTGFPVGFQKGELAEACRQLKLCQSRHLKNLSARSAGALAFAAVRAERAGALKPKEREKIIARLTARPGFKKAALEGAYRAAEGGSKLQAQYWLELCLMDYQSSPSANNAYLLANAAVWAASKGAISAKQCAAVIEKLSENPEFKAHALLGAYVAARPGSPEQKIYRDPLMEALRELPLELPASLSESLGEHLSIKHGRSMAPFAEPLPMA